MRNVTPLTVPLIRCTTIAMLEIVRWTTLVVAWVSTGVLWWSFRTMRKANRNMQAVVQGLVVASSNMWDTMTPEQIRTLHPITVQVGNDVPPWELLKEAM